MPKCGDGGEPIDTPCSKLKNLTNPTKANTKPLIIGGMYDYINNSSSGESGIYLKKDQQGILSSEIAPYTSSNSIPIKTGDTYYSAIHSHPKDTYPMFSWSDIYTLYLLEMNTTSFNDGLSSFLLVCEDDNGVKQTYAIVFEDIGKMIEETINNPRFTGYSIEEICKEMDKELEKKYIIESQKAIPNYERPFLQFNFNTNIVYFLRLPNQFFPAFPALFLANNDKFRSANGFLCCRFLRIHFVISCRGFWLLHCRSTEFRADL